MADLNIAMKLGDGEDFSKSHIRFREYKLEIEK